MCITKRELVRDTIAVHGHHWTARRYVKRMPFTLFYWLAFGRAPRKLQAAPRDAAWRY